MILIFDFGSQYTLLIKKILDNFNIHSAVYHHNELKNLFNNFKHASVSGVIFSGGPKNIKPEEHLAEFNLLEQAPFPILGICFGFQLIVSYLGGEITKHKTSEFGKTIVKQTENKSKLFEKIDKKTYQTWMSHSNGIIIPREILKKINVTSYSENNFIASFELKKKPIFALQYHPEVDHTEYGKQILENFIFNICNEKRIFKNSIEAILEKKTIEVKNKLGENKVSLALSGGTDSTILAVFLNSILKNGQLICLFIDNGLLRKDEVKEVKTLFKEYKLPVEYFNYRSLFFKNLKNIKKPEVKRKIIGKTFIKIFEKILKNKNIKYLAQGTIHSDVVESSLTETKAQKVIKSHHNVGGLPKNMKLKLVEPFSDLLKDSVRELGKTIGLRSSFLKKHPFPGPGLGVRIIGEVTPSKVAILQKADHILINILREKNIYYYVSQAFTVLLSDKTTGVKGDNRSYGFVIAIRLVTTKNFMTASIYHLDYSILETISSDITNKIPQVVRVVYDITSKPPGTIEWE
ncbi:glutamine-hydrolyzing GMP synthase [Mycoplasma sp. SG1]|uniref:glutamine-hydrolyzing GMP synthase n=1 Tax=Mycoplasma sp. SG1 TaxID=2810348 RepID=UPI002024C2E7|nr:glutamine-hydrolyzing GMP synthase [Mycoplasma sp. SG1]URM52851.1 glutamine-hydrolyzing GMP synthase [Mycoplasma sp. SG1]